MNSPATHRTKLDELSWLADARQKSAPTQGHSPIWVRSVTVRGEESSNPVTSPEFHPYCEIGIMLEGGGIMFVEREEARRKPGELFLAGPGVPHWLKLTRFPVRFITVFFYPRLLLEQMADSDDVQMLRRFTSRQPLAARLVFPPPPLRAHITRLFLQMEGEYAKAQFGREVKLRALLTHLLVDLMRWEQGVGHHEPSPKTSGRWQPLDRALLYLKEHYQEPIYGRDLAKAAGVSQTRLKSQFHEELGMPWSRYLQCYRVHMAAALLNDPNRSVTDVALAVGFESLSHFNATFRSIMGLSPGVYAKRVNGVR
jgi:AraC-like DNA-binding protein